MAMFGGKHYSNPAHGKFMSGGQDQEPDGMADGGGGMKAKSYHVHHHADGTAHSHIHHADDSHEHTDHASAEEAHDHVQKAVGDGMQDGSEPDGDEAEQGPKPTKLHNVNRMSSGGF